MLCHKLQGFLNKSASILFVLWIYVASPLLTISIIGEYRVKAATDSMTFNIIVTEIPPEDTIAPSLSFTGFKNQTSGSYDSSQTTKACGSLNSTGYISWEWTLTNTEVTPVIFTYSIISGPASVGVSMDTVNTHVNGGITAEGTYVVEVFGTDNNGDGNSGTPVQCSVTYDATAPVTTDSTDVAWHNTDVTVSLSCSDIEGSGCYKTHYKVDGNPYVEGKSVTISDEGVHTIKYYSEDWAGNVEAEKSAAFAVKIDKTGPFLRLPENQIFDENSDGEYQYSFSASASEFDFEPTVVVINPVVTCLPDQAGFDYPVGTTTVNCSATDRAGNNGVKSFTVTVNNLVPTVSISAIQNGNNSYTFTANPVGGNAPYSYAWNNDCSGTGSTASTGSTPATYNCTVTVTDADGDFSSESIVRTVKEAPIVPALFTPQGQGQGAKTTEETEEETPDLSPDEEVLGERTCTSKVKFIGYTYIDKNKSNKYELEEKLLPSITGQIGYSIDGIEYIAKTFISDQNGKFEVQLCPGDYKVAINDSSLPTGVRNPGEAHQVSILGEATEATAYLALLATSGMVWSWWGLVIGLLILGVIYFVYRQRGLALEGN